MTRTSRALAFAAIGSALTLTAACSGRRLRQGRRQPPANESSSGLTATLLPPIAQAGPEAASADDAEAVVAARTEPAEEGVELTLEQDTGSGWEEVGTAETNAAGTADFTVEGGADAVYQVSADGGAPSKVSGDMDARGRRRVRGRRRSTRHQWYHRGEDVQPRGSPRLLEGLPRRRRRQRRRAGPQGPARSRPRG